MIEAVKLGSFEADAFAAAGIAWKVAVAWLKLGEASFALHSEDGRPLTWQGNLFKRLRAAKADRLTPVMQKLHKQAKEDGGANATRYLDAIGSGRGGGSNGRQLGQDYQEEDISSGVDSMSDDDLLELVNNTIASALSAADHRRISDRGEAAG